MINFLRNLFEKHIEKYFWKDIETNIKKEIYKFFNKNEIY